MLPRTLLTRLFLLLALLMMVSALVWATIISMSDQEPRARQLAQLLTSVANLTRSAIVAAAPDRRHDLLAEMSGKEGIRVYLSEDYEISGTVPLDPFLERVQEILKQNLGPDTMLLVQRKAERGLVLRVGIEGDDYWIAMPERFNRSRSFQWLGWGVFAALLALLAAGAFVSRPTRPLRDLANAALEIGAGRFPKPLAGDGPEELATVALAFNRMNADLARLEQDRALILAGVSHDLRTPLTRLRMGIEMSTSDDALRAGMLSDIEEMDATIGQFLDFARADGGEGPVETDLAALIDDLAEQFRKRGARIETQARATPLVMVHPQALRRALGNLVANALRYAGNNDPVMIGLSAGEHDVRIEVSDRGPGIPPDQVERLKQPFTRLETARGNAVGAGLGLAIVDRIARQHGGRLELAARPGGGLTAGVTIPAG